MRNIRYGTRFEYDGEEYIVEFEVTAECIGDYYTPPTPAEVYVFSVKNAETKEEVHGLNDDFFDAFERTILGEN